LESPKRRLHAFIFILILLAALPLRAEGGLVNILYLSSYEAGSANNAAIVGAVKSGLASFGLRAEVFLECLDVYRFPFTAGKAAYFEESIATRYAGERFDIILAQGNQALETAMGLRARQLPGVPLYCFDAIDPDVVSRHSSLPQVYGRVLGSPLPPTLRLAIQLFPRTKRVFFLATIENDRYIQAFHDSLDPLREEFPGREFIPLVNAAFSEVEAALAGAGPDSVALLLPGSWRLPDGRFLGGREAVSRLEAKYPIPYFGVDESSFGSGLVGGCIVDRELMGLEACGMTHAILYSPEKPLPWLYSTSTVPILDARALARFSVHPSLAPNDAKILFSPPGFWVRHELALELGGGALILLSLILIVIMLMKRRQAAFLRESNERLELRVAARTEELRTANAELESMNENLVESLRRIEGMQDRLVANTRETVLGRIALALAHEINNPLAAIKASVSSMKAVLDAGSAGGHPASPELVVKREGLRHRAHAAGPGTGEPRPPDPAAVAATAERLAGLGFPERAGLADLLVDAGLAGVDDADLVEVSAPENADILDYLYGVHVFERGVEIAALATDRIAATVETVRSYAREIEGGEGGGRASVQASVDRALGLFSEVFRQDVRLVREMEPGIPPVAASDSRLVRVWVNLVQNAIQAMDSKGELVVRARREGGSALVEVEDSGPCVEASLQPGLFTPFASREGLEKGLGLGLSLCKRIVEAAGGGIWYLERGGRPVFSVRLPLLEE
jgi:signal transduction histidine kinase